MLESLDEEDLLFIQFLLDLRKKKKVAKSKNILEEIQRMFQDDEGWDNEERMIAVMVYYGSKLKLYKKIFTAIKTYPVHTILSKFC